MPPWSHAPSGGVHVHLAEAAVEGKMMGRDPWDGGPLYIHSRKLTWNLKMMVSNRKLLFQVSIFGCHVSFRGCTYIYIYTYIVDIKQLGGLNN